MAGKLWVRQIYHNKLARDVVVPCENLDWAEALRLACHQMDLSVPLFVPRHQRDWEDFRLLRFLPGDFMEAVRFDRLEAEFFDPEYKNPPDRMNADRK